MLVTDRVRKNDSSIEWCPTGKMIGDCAAKPLQGPTFKRFRDCIVGVAPVEGPEPKKSESIGDKTGRPKGRQLFGDRNERHHRSALGFGDSWMRIICWTEDVLDREQRNALLSGDSANWETSEHSSV